MKEVTAAEPDASGSSEPKTQPSGLPQAVVSGESSHASRRRRHSGDGCDVVDCNSQPGPPILECLLKDHLLSAADLGENRSTRESSPVSDRGSQNGLQNAAERSLRTSVSFQSLLKEQSRSKRDTNGTASSSTSTCSEDSELRINDFLGETGQVGYMWESDSDNRK